MLGQIELCHLVLLAGEVNGPLASPVEEFPQAQILSRPVGRLCHNHFPLDRQLVKGQDGVSFPGGSGAFRLSGRSGGGLRFRLGAEHIQVDGPGGTEQEEGTIQAGFGRHSVAALDLGKLLCQLPVQCQHQKACFGELPGQPGNVLIGVPAVGGAGYHFQTAVRPKMAQDFDGGFGLLVQLLAQLLHRFPAIRLHFGQLQGGVGHRGAQLPKEGSHHGCIHREGGVAGGQNGLELYQQIPALRGKKQRFIHNELKAVQQQLPKLFRTVEQGSRLTQNPGAGFREGTPQRGGQVCLLLLHLVDHGFLGLHLLPQLFLDGLYRLRGHVAAGFPLSQQAHGAQQLCRVGLLVDFPVLQFQV